MEDSGSVSIPLTSQLGGAARFHGDQAESIFTPAIPKKLNRKSSPLTLVRSDAAKPVGVSWLA